jgi:hypothetical protein
MENDAQFNSAYCGEVNYTFVDLSSGYQQSYVVPHSARQTV